MKRPLGFTIPDGATMTGEYGKLHIIGNGQAIEVCGDFIANRCTRGDNCKYSHGEAFGSKIQNTGAVVMATALLPTIPAEQKPTPLGQGETWACQKCNNENWPRRTSCNNKKCGASGPWTCPACLNRNVQGREVCNKKGCGQPRPGAAEVIAALLGMPGGNPASANMQTLNSIMAQMSTATCGTTGNAPDGSWVCLGCSNINFPLRTTCNNKLCLMTRDQADGGPPPVTISAAGADLTTMGMGSMAPATMGVMPSLPSLGLPAVFGGSLSSSFSGVSPPPPPPPPPSSGGVFLPMTACAAAASSHHIPMGGTGGPKPYQEGSWTCGACQNVNFPLRKQCNNKKCSLPREQCDAGPPGAGGAASALASQAALIAAGLGGFSNTPPPPSMMLGNTLGYLPGIAGFSSVPPMAMAPAAVTAAGNPEGSWSCIVCSNINWPQRTSCNNKACGAPRLPEFSGSGHLL